MSDEMFMYDETEETKTRFIGFVGESTRFDLAILQTNQFYGKMLVYDIQKGNGALIGTDDLQEEGYLEHAFELSEEEAQDLHNFLTQVIV